MYEKYFHKYRSVQASETMAAIFRKLVIVGAAIRSWQFVANSSLLRATALGRFLPVQIGEINTKR
ncbi:TPA: hypothetical protein ACPWHR_005753, partial [Pseudomonas aeruginosa]